MKLLILPLLILLGAGASTARAEVKNLLRNPSFEIDADGNQRADFWEGPFLKDGSIGGAVYLDRALPMNGFSQVTAVFLKEGEHALRQSVKVEPNTQYTLRGWIHGQAARGNAWIRFREKGEKNRVWESARMGQGHNDWAPYDVRFKTGPKTVEGEVEFVWQLSKQGVLRFDFISLTKGQVPAEPGNTAPRLRDDFLEVERNTVFGLAAPGVMRNDEDIEKDKLEVVDCTDAQHGSVSIQKNGSVVYRPKPDFTGKDTVSYRVRDAQGGESSAKLTFEVKKFPVPANLLVNGSFEALDSVAWEGDANARETSSRSGRRALVLTPGDVGKQVKVPFQAGKRYRLSAWVKGSTKGGNGLRIFYAHPNGRRHWHTAPLTGEFGWQKVVVEFGSRREPVVGGSVVISAEFESGSVWVDDVVLEEFPLPYHVFIDGHSVTGGVVPILKELGRDALEKGITDRMIDVTRSPNTLKNHIIATQPFDVALICSWAAEAGDKDFQGEIPRLRNWQSWFAKLESPPRMAIFNWQPWGLHQWPKGFLQLAEDYEVVARKLDLQLVPCVLAFQKVASRSKDPQAALRKLYFGDYHHAGREGNYLKACCAFTAVTGKSPVGLTHIMPIDIDFGWPPETLTIAEAHGYQKAAWESWLEVNQP